MLELVPQSLRLAADELPGESLASAAEVGNQSGIDWCILSSWRRPGDTYIIIYQDSGSKPDSTGTHNNAYIGSHTNVSLFLCFFVSLFALSLLSILISTSRFAMICLVGQGIMCGRYGAIRQNVVLNGWMFIFILWSVWKRHSGF